MTYIVKWNTKFYLTKERVSKFVLIQIIKLNCDFSDKNVDNGMKKKFFITESTLWHEVFIMIQIYS